MPKFKARAPRGLYCNVTPISNSFLNEKFYGHLINQSIKPYNSSVASIKFIIFITVFDKNLFFSLNHPKNCFPWLFLQLGINSLFASNWPWLIALKIVCQNIDFINKHSFSNCQHAWWQSEAAINYVIITCLCKYYHKFVLNMIELSPKVMPICTGIWHL